MLSSIERFSFLRTYGYAFNIDIKALYPRFSLYKDLYVLYSWAPRIYMTLIVAHRNLHISFAWSVELRTHGELLIYLIGRSKCDFEYVSFNLVLLIGIFKSSYDYVLK